VGKGGLVKLATMLIVAVMAVLIVAFAGCAHHTWTRLPDCGGDGQLWHVDNDLICYGRDGGPYASREWRATDTHESACMFCREWDWR
jgi:hypothetical protein